MDVNGPRKCKHFGARAGGHWHGSIQLCELRLRGIARTFSASKKEPKRSDHPDVHFAHAPEMGVLNAVSRGLAHNVRELVLAAAWQEARARKIMLR